MEFCRIVMAWHDETSLLVKKRLYSLATILIWNPEACGKTAENCHGRLDETLHVFCKALFCVYISIECPEFIHFRRPWKHCNHQQIRCISPALILECNVASGRRLFLTSLTCCRCVFQCGEWIMISSNPHVVKTSVQVIQFCRKMFVGIPLSGKKELPSWRKGL